MEPEIIDYGPPLRDVMALGIRLVHGRLQESNITLTFQGNHTVSGRSLHWCSVWHRAIAATARTMKRSGKMLPSEAEKLQEAALQDSPLVRALAERGGAFLEQSGILAVLGPWDPQSGIIHAGRKGGMMVHDIAVSTADPDQTRKELVGCVVLLASILRETGEEGASLAADLDPESDALSLWAPLPAPDLADLEGCGMVPLGAFGTEDGAPIRIFGPEPATCKALRLLVRAVWRDLFGGAVLVRWPSPTVPTGLVRRVLEPMREGALVGEEEGMVLRRGGALVGRFPALDQDVVSRILNGRTDLFRSMTFVRLVLALPWWTWNQAVAGVNPYTRLEFAGLSALGEDLGVSDRTEIAGLPDLLLAGQEYRGARLDLPPLWMAHLPADGKMGRGRHVSSVRIDVGPALAPYGYTKFGKGEDQRLLPVPKVPRLDSINRRRRAAGVFLQLALLSELRESVARGNTRNGAIELTRQQMERAADGVQVSRPELDALVSVWIGDLGTDAWMIREGEGMVRLADAGAHEVLMDAAERADGNRRKYKRKA